MPKRSQSEVAARRRKVAELWIQGITAVSISDELEVPVRTVWHDIEAIRAELAGRQRTTLDQQRARSVAVLREVQRVAWQRFNRAKDGSTNLPGLLNVIMNAEQLIAKLEGTLGPDVQSQTTVNVLALPEWQQTRGAILTALQAYPEARIAVADALAQLEEPNGARTER